MPKKKKEGRTLEAERREVQMHKGMIYLENVRTELGKLMAGVARDKLGPDYKEPESLLRNLHFILLAMGNQW